MRDPSDVYLSRADANGCAVVQMAANRFVDNGAKDAGWMVTGAASKSAQDGMRNDRGNEVSSRGL